MGFLKRTLEYAVGRSLSEVINKTVKQALEPKATEYANRASRHLSGANENQAYTDADNLEGAMSNLNQNLNAYANRVAAAMKVCPSCEKPSSSDKKFCPHCGTKLPEKTLAEERFCSSCGKENAPGTKFCTGCGAKLSSPVQEEQVQESPVEE